MSLQTSIVSVHGPILNFDFNMNPDPAFYSNAAPDPAFHFNADPDSAFHFNAHPNPAPLQRDGNLRQLAYRDSRAPF